MCKERQSATSEWIPERNFATPKTFPMMVGERITKETEIPKIERVLSENDVRIRHTEQHQQDDGKPPRRKPVIRRV